MRPDSVATGAKPGIGEDALRPGVAELRGIHARLAARVTAISAGFVFCDLS